ncbi:cell wall-binding repeat-containing protein [Bacillus marinisedimentorum]|uniref:cell wall-binding repeat-containing protein n=1 Tax=Bacillus marinisedimentorum TaxID=1821260 RepID=UPI0007DF6A31|nr:cell wall-binding repeat-containing protein [Bacillus marinisedimentorum]
MKLIISLVSSIFLSTLLLLNQSFANGFFIKDPRLELAVQDSFGETNSENLTKETLNTISQFDGSWYDITDLSGIENASQINHLYLTGNQINDIALLTGLEHLETLDLSNNNISDLSPLDALQNISFLRLDSNAIADISPLSDLEFYGEHTELLIDHNNINDLSPLLSIKFSEINSEFLLDISFNNISEVSSLQNLSNTKVLEASNNKISNINGLENLADLQYLNLSHNQIDNLSSLSILNNLRDINLSNNILTTITGLNFYKGRNYYLDLSNNNINDISNLVNVTSGYIDLRNNKITTISSLKNFRKGTVLLNGNPLLSQSTEIIEMLKSWGVNILHDPIAAPEASSERIFGSGRYQTAAEISQQGWDNSQTVVIARGDSFPDALAGTPLAHSLHAPILLTEQSKLSTATKNEIVRLGATKAIILGGKNAITQQVEIDLQNINVKNIERIAGNGRFETARKIAGRVNQNPEKAVIVYGYNFPDALAIASYAAQNGYPILLTDKDKLPYHTKEALKGVESTIAVGGETVINSSVFEQLENPLRINGTNRYETAAKVITKLKLFPDSVFIANGKGFADALAGSVLAARRQSSLLLVESDKVPKETVKIFNDYQIYHHTVLGGKAVVEDSVINTLLSINN